MAKQSAVEHLQIGGNGVGILVDSSGMTVIPAAAIAS